MGEKHYFEEKSMHFFPSWWLWIHWIWKEKGTLKHFIMDRHLCNQSVMGWMMTLFHFPPILSSALKVTISKANRWAAGSLVWRGAADYIALPWKAAKWNTNNGNPIMLICFDKRWTQRRPIKIDNKHQTPATYQTWPKLRQDIMTSYINVFS